MLNVNGRKSIFFSKFLDTYEEVDDGTSNEAVRVTREDWSRKAKWTLDAADALVSITSSVLGQPSLNYVGAYVAITVDGNNYMWLHKRTSDKSLLTFRMAPSLQDEAAGLLDGKNITYVRKTKSIKVTVDKEMIERNAELFTKIAALIKKSWQGGA